jgi:hypothetical protein
MDDSCSVLVDAGTIICPTNIALCSSTRTDAYECKFTISNEVTIHRAEADLKMPLAVRAAQA